MIKEAERWSQVWGKGETRSWGWRRTASTVQKNEDSKTGKAVM